MSVFVALWNSDPFRRVKIDEVDLECTVEELQSQVAKIIGDNEIRALDLTFCGLVLGDKTPLSSYGITSGVTLHAIDKIDNSKVTLPKKITEAEVQEIVSSFRNFKSSPGFRSTLHRLQSPEEVDKVIAAVPGLENDTIAISFISRPDLIIEMEDPKAVWKIGERHPLLLEAAKYIATVFHGTTAPTSSTHSSLPGSSSGFSYSLDALSDDDEAMNEGASSGAQEITAEHVSAALAQAARAAGNRLGSGAGGITAEMLQQALPGSRYTEQLRQMRELGMTDDGRNSRALAVTQGDVQAAINLIFSGALDD